MDQKFQEPKTKQGRRFPPNATAAITLAQTLRRTKCLALFGMLLTVIATAPIVLAANPSPLVVMRMSAPNAAPDGSFEPSRQTYTLSNRSDSFLPWAASKNRDWLSLTATDGVLGPSAATNVTVFANSLAGQLPPGSHTGTINFINNSTGEGNSSRNLTLNVRKPATI